MRIKKYTGASMKEALLEIKKDLGENAMILKTRRLPKKLFSVGAQAEIEVTAAVDDTGGGNVPTLNPIKITEPGIYSRPKPLGVKNALTASSTTATIAYPEAPPRSETSADRLRLFELKEDIREVKDFLKSILQTGETSAAGGFAGSWAVLYKRLIDAEINAELAEELVREIKNSKTVPDAEVEKKFVTVLSERFAVSGPIKQKQGGPLIVAFVGPTGSGKTTTLAKLAAHCKLEKGLNVSLVTADTYRIAAIEQIRTFAEIVNIGLKVVFSADEIPSVMQSCGMDDIIFVDTAGRSQKNPAHMRELEDLLASLRPDETHLVLSATTKDSDLADIIRRYNKCSVNRLLFTKLDETARLGNVYNIVTRNGIPVSYLTTGQGVPDDIELARPGRFVQKLWEGSSL